MDKETAKRFLKAMRDGYADTIEAIGYNNGCVIRIVNPKFRGSNDPDQHDPYISLDLGEILTKYVENN